jgi:hypothetical protein
MLVTKDGGKQVQSKEQKLNTKLNVRFADELRIQKSYNFVQPITADIDSTDTLKAPDLKLGGNLKNIPFIGHGAE